MSNKRGDSCQILGVLNELNKNPYASVHSLRFAQSPTVCFKNLGKASNQDMFLTVYTDYWHFPKFLRMDKNNHSNQQVGKIVVKYILPSKITCVFEQS